MDDEDCFARVAVVRNDGDGRRRQVTHARSKHRHRKPSIPAGFVGGRGGCSPSGMRLLLLTTLLSLGANAAPERSHVPQVRDAWELFRGLGEEPVPLPATTVLFCQVSVPSLRYDSFAGADLRVSLSVNGVAAGDVNGPQDEDVVLVSFPLTLARGDRVTMTVWDRDVFETEFIGAGTVTLGEALPVSFTRSPFKASCRGLPEAMTLARQTTTMEQLDEALEALGPLPPVKLSEQNLGRPDVLFRELDDALYAAGSWQPWKRPALAERLRRAQAVETQWKRAVVDEIAAQVSQLPQATQPVLLQAGVTQVQVGALRCVRGNCSLALELQNLSTEPLERSTTSVPQEAFDRAQVLSATGAIVELELGAPGPDAGIAPGSSGSVKLKGWWEPTNGAPRLLRVHTPFGWKVLRLREP